jgi:hypothetical protein
MDQAATWWNFNGVFPRHSNSLILPLKMYYIPPRWSWAIFSGILVEFLVDWGQVL